MRKPEDSHKTINGEAADYPYFQTAQSLMKQITNTDTVKEKRNDKRFSGVQYP